MLRFQQAIKYMISTELVLIHTHQDLLLIPYPLFKLNYFLNKYH